MQTPLSFNEQVYALVSAIPRGKVLSYGRVALLLGVPHGARQVGWALAGLGGRARDVPWQRVVNVAGRISIKGRPEAAIEQRARLEAEGVHFDEHDTLDLRQHLWQPDLDEVEAILAGARRAQRE